MGHSLLVERSWRSAGECTRSEIRVILVSVEGGRGGRGTREERGLLCPVVRSRICVALGRRPVRVRPDPTSMVDGPWLRVWMCHAEVQAAATGVSQIVVQGPTR